MPSFPSRARGAVSRGADSTWLEHLTRGGLVGYGVIHLLFAWLIVRIAFSGAGTDGDQSGALHRLAGKPFGTVLIGLIVVGLIAMVIWQLLEVVVGQERIISAGRAAFYSYLSWSGIKVLRGKDKSSADMQQQASEDLMTSGGGRFVVALAGVAIAAIGIGLVIFGITKKFEKHLKLREMSAHIRRLTQRLGIIGYAAKGGSYAIAGLLFVVAAIRYDPDKARGLDAALNALAGQAYGPWLLALVALGFAAYGLFSIVQSRYRKV
ncbi:DUF1206 domain-containing protein [Winogradskya humida]|uniref:Membrane protein n=1 Tax=Winogradskya humida TaxID=113566 RepID=A0ABQ3ZU88_9ACTN|nr:DUF1206 domain-containing protein [Actinoplanes humidus]GIE22175.1 membrane protein [Actinoplanes humidus]